MKMEKKSYEDENDTIAKRIPAMFKTQLESPKAFWERLGEFFVEVVRCVSKEDWKYIKEARDENGDLKWKHPIYFVEECL